MTPKVLYSCMAYIKQLTMAHNRKLLDMQEKKKQMCGCKKKRSSSQWQISSQKLNL